MSKARYSSRMNAGQEKSCLIVGCGYVGKPLAEALLSEGWRVGAVVKSEISSAALADQSYEVFQGDVADPLFWQQPDPVWKHVIYCPSTGGGGVEAYRQIHEIGLMNVLNWLPAGARLLYTSSTSVYGQSDGEVVDEDSVTEPASPSAQELVKAEHRVCDAGQTVLRLAGIYGPERGVLLKRLRAGGALIPQQDPKWLNLIYLTDIVSVIRHALTGKLKSGSVYNVTDNEPASYREIFQWLCDRLQLPLPDIGTPDYFGKRGITNKRVSNQKLRNTGWQPQYPSFREGYEAMLSVAD
ncbi:MAG: SDR family oxidoreductase [Verrucomicrobiota bacterium]